MTSDHGPERSPNAGPATGGDATWMEPLRQSRLFEDIVDSIESAIRAGHLQAGERIPSERELAERFGVSRAAVREAIRVLDALGLVSIERGARGVRLSSQAGSTLTRYLRLSLALDHFSLTSILEFRAVVESWAAKQVARRKPAEILDELRSLTDQMNEPAIAPGAWSRLHWQFHATLVAGCPNELAVAALKACQEVISSEMKAAFARSSLPHLQLEHKEIYDAIVSGDDDLSAKLVLEHIARRNRLKRTL